MKTKPILSMLATISLASGGAFASSSSTPILLTVVSPDHPHTWVVGAHKEPPKLRWDSSRHVLVADIKYSTEDYADSVNPTEIDYHTLSFPNIRLASNGTDLLATDRFGETARVGRIENGFLGKTVVLSKDTDLVVHRVQGKIYATLIYSSVATE